MPESSSNLLCHKDSTMSFGGQRQMNSTKLHYNPAQDSVALKYSPSEWDNSNFTRSNILEKEKQSGQQLRREVEQTISEAAAMSKINQTTSNRKLGQRINDISQRHSELTEECDLMKCENALLGEFRKALNKLHKEIEKPLECAQECLVFRERRWGIDIVHDKVEKALLKEICVIKKWKTDVKNLFKTASIQIKLNTSAMEECEKDIHDKQKALITDESAQRISIPEKGPVTGVQIHTVSVPATWMKWTRNNIVRSQKERKTSENTRYEIDNCLRMTAKESWGHFNHVNSCLKERIAEITKARNHLETELHQTQHELAETRNSVATLQKTLKDLEKPLKVAESRLQKRLMRPNIENCDDSPTKQLQDEIRNIQTSRQALDGKLKDCQLQHSKLAKLKSVQEYEIKVKENSLDIDRNMCLAARKNIPCSFTAPVYRMPIIK